MANLEFSCGEDNFGDDVMVDGNNNKGDYEKEFAVYRGVIFANPNSEIKSIDAKRRLVDTIGDFTSSKRIIWIDDQDVEYARGYLFRHPLLCFPFQNEL